MKMGKAKEKLMPKKRNNLETINKTYLDNLKNQYLRIYQREKEIEYLDSLFKPTPIMSNKLIKSSFNNQFYHTKDNFYKTNNSNYNLPRINTTPNYNTINRYDRMKNYKVIFKKKKDLLPEEKIKKFLYQSGFTYIPTKIKLEQEKKLNDINTDNTNNGEKNNNINKEEKNNNIKDKNNKNEKIKENNNIEKKHSFSLKNNVKLNIKNDISNNNINEDKINSNRTKNQMDNKKELNKKIKNKNMDFEYYLKMQSKAEIILKPKIGDNSNDLVNYINAIQGIRENLMTDILSEINKTENRYNKEKP